MPETCPSGAALKEATDFLAAHPEIEAIDIVLHDSNGIGRGKIIHRHELESLYKNGRHMPISILGLDVVGEDVDETGLIWDTGDGDLRAALHLGEIALPRSIGIDDKFISRLRLRELHHAAEGKLRLCLVEHMEEDHVVAPLPQP